VCADARDGSVRHGTEFPVQDIPVRRNQDTAALLYSPNTLPEPTVVDRS
jgi:hypothetical protein